MILSVRNKFKGGFDYFQAPDTVPINDDFPAFVANGTKTRLGIPASVAARPLPPGASRIGHGNIPKGSICSGKTGAWRQGGVASRLVSGLSGFDTTQATGIGLVVASVVVIAIAATMLSDEK
jgi:hypothetical protein